MIPGMEHGPPGATFKPTRFPPGVLSRGAQPWHPQHHWPVAGRRGCSGIGQAAGMGQLGAAGDESLQDVLPVVLHPTHQTVLQVRVSLVTRVLRIKKNTNQSDVTIKNKQNKIIHTNHNNT